MSVFKRKNTSDDSLGKREIENRIAAKNKLVNLF